MPDIEDAMDAGYEKWYERAACGATGLEKSRAAYVFHCARNALLKLLDKKAHEVSIGEVTWELTAEDDAEIRRNEKGDVRYLFSKLPKPWKRVMQLFWIEGFEISEIAELMQRSKGAIYHIKEKAEKRFKELGIKELGYPPPQKPHQANLKINRKNLKIRRGISRGIRLYTLSARTKPICRSCAKQFSNNFRRNSRWQYRMVVLQEADPAAAVESFQVPARVL